MTATPQQPSSFKFVVKQVVSGDQVILFAHDKIKGGPPAERTLIFSNILAPKLGKLARNNLPESKDEPYAWEAREFLRRKLVGEEVTYTKDQQTTARTNAEFGVLFTKDNENVTDLLVREGFAKVREGRPSDERTKLLESQEVAKTAKKNIWDEANAAQHVREIRGAPDNLEQFVRDNKAPVDGLIEYVLDGSRFRVVLLPNFYHVTIALTGIRCPSVREPKDGESMTKQERDEQEVAKEARSFVELRILQRDLQFVLEGVSDANTASLYGSVLHPKGNISEVLLKTGLAQCVDWSIGNLKSVPVSQLRNAEKFAKENRLKRWKDHIPPPKLTGKEREFQGTVVEVVSGDQLKVQVGSSPPLKIFLSSIRPPRDERKQEEGAGGAPVKRPGGSRALYEVPWLFEAREYLRKKLIGKSVNVTVDYKQPANEKLPEKTCCTVKIGGTNVAETLVSKGLARVVRHANNDDNRSPHYDELKAAEEKASKSGKGVHSKDQPTLRVTDVSADAARARTFLPSLQRGGGRIDAVVEFVTSGSRLRIYIPKESCMATFLLAGISCPRGARLGPPATQGEPFSDEALAFTHSRVMQREVEVVVDSIDKAGNFIGWLWIDGNNLSVALVKEGLASVHFSAEKSVHYRSLSSAEAEAKSKRLNIWTNYVEEEKPEEKIEEDTVTERKVDYQTVVVTEVTSELKFFAQAVDQGPKLEALMTQIRQEFQTNPPLPGAYSPRKGDLCAAKFSDDDWYRARVERVQAGKVHVLYVDYGNREVTSAARCASLPAAFTTDKPYANEFQLAFVRFPPDPEDQSAAVKALREDIQDMKLLLNVEYKIEKTIYASLALPDSQADVAKGLISEAFLMVDSRRDKRLQKIVSDLKKAEEEARKGHKGIWQYGDITEDDAKEFGR